MRADLARELPTQPRRMRGCPPEGIRTADRVGDSTARKAANEHPDEHAGGDCRLPGGIVTRALQNGPSAEHLDCLGSIGETQGTVHEGEWRASLRSGQQRIVLARPDLIDRVGGSIFRRCPHVDGRPAQAPDAGLLLQEPH